jgi:ABC-type cobalamin/Fe3+-siderophores transport system ATPase subunit
LEDEVARLVAERPGGLVRLVGPEGSGKTTSLEHLAAVLAGTKVYFFDHSLSHDHDLLPSDNACWVVRATDVGGADTYRLAPWGEDEWIEYLLAVHQHRCASVMTRLRVAADWDILHGNPDWVAGNDGQYPPCGGACLASADGQ